MSLPREKHCYLLFLLCVHLGVAVPRVVMVNSRRLRIDIPTLLLVSLSGSEEMTASLEKTTSTTPQFITERERATQIRGKLEMSLDIISVRCIIPSYTEIHRLGITTLLTALGIKHSAIIVYRLQAKRKHK